MKKSTISEIVSILKDEFEIVESDVKSFAFDDCYLVKKGIYITFLKSKLEKRNIDEVLIDLSKNAPKDKNATYILVAETDEVFDKKELVYVNDSSLTVRFLLFSGNTIYANKGFSVLPAKNTSKIISKILSFYSYADIEYC